MAEAIRSGAVPPEPPRPHGRSLADFGELSPAERALCESCRLGTLAVIGEERPDEETDGNRVRAALVRFLALGGDARAPVHEHGVQLQGAWLSGGLDLSAARVEQRLALVSCTIGWINLVQATMKFLDLRGSRLTAGLEGDALRCEGSLLLRDGFHVTGEVWLFGATIGGNVECTGGRLDAGEGEALNLQGARIDGSVMLRRPFHAAGSINLRDSAIRGGVDCGGGRIDGGAQGAILADRATIGGMALREGFQASGTVRLNAARLGELDCGEASFDSSDYALSCDNVRVDRVFFFRWLNGLRGAVDLSGMQVPMLCDDAESWEGARGRLVLDGFAYGALGGGAPTDAAARIAWLDLQVESHLGSDFRPQPWEQLIAVLRAMGHPDDARAVAIAKQHRLRRSGRLTRGPAFFHRLYGALMGYGYRPLRLLGVAALLWLACALAYWAAANPGWFGADVPLIRPAGHPPGGDVASAYRSFEPLIYSADVLLPVIDFGYQGQWTPAVADAAGQPLLWGRLLRYLYWFEIAFGWVAGLLLVGVLGNLIKKD